MKKIIGLLIVLSLGLTSCTKQTTPNVIIKSKSLPAVQTFVQPETVSIPYPTILGRMADKPMIKGYRPPRPTFGLKRFEIGTGKLMALMIGVALIIKGVHSLFAKKQETIIAKFDKDNLPVFNVQGEVKAKPDGQFDAVPKGYMKCKPAKSARMEVSNSDQVTIAVNTSETPPIHLETSTNFKDFIHVVTETLVQLKDMCMRLAKQQEDFGSDMNMQTTVKPKKKFDLSLLSSSSDEEKKKQKPAIIIPDQNLDTIDSI
jgi:hypothetical protein